MFSKLLSAAKYPFNHLVPSFAALTGLYFLRIVRLYYKKHQEMKAMIDKVPTIDDAAAPDFPVAPKQRKAAEMLKKLKDAAPNNGAKSLKKIGFCYEEDFEALANNVRTIKTEESYAILIGQNALNAFTKAELRAVLAHEVGHVQHADVGLLRQVLGAVDTTNQPVFMLAGLTTISLGIKSLFHWSEQMPSMLKLLLVSALIAQAYKTYSRRCEFRADQNVLVLKEDPHALISALKKKDQLDEEWLARFNAQLPAAEQNKKVITFHSFFHPYPSIKERQKALGIQDEVRESPAL